MKSAASKRKADRPAEGVHVTLLKTVKKRGAWSQGYRPCGYYARASLAEEVFVQDVNCRLPLRCKLERLARGASTSHLGQHSLNLFR